MHILVYISLRRYMYRKVAIYKILENVSICVGNIGTYGKIIIFTVNLSYIFEIEYVNFISDSRKILAIKVNSIKVIVK